MARPRGFMPVSRRSQKTTDWGVGAGGTVLTSLTASGSSILGAGAAPVEPKTIVRTRGLFSASLTVGAAGNGFFGAVGIGIVSQPAFTAGIASMPTPISEAVWEGWMWYSFFDCRTGVNPDDGSSIHRIEVDSKAMRKVSNDDVIFAAIEVVEVGTATLEVQFDTRILLKSP